MLIQLKKETEEKGFLPFKPISGRKSIADLFPGDVRSGIYILSFHDGAFYVGRTKNVVARHAAHCRVHSDIKAIAFKPLAIKLQDSFEQSMIHDLEKKGYRLRNKLEASIPYGESDLDYVISPEAQNEWLKTGHLALQEKIERGPFDDVEYDQKENFTKLLEEQNSEEIIKILSEYTLKAILAPWLTEPAFWSLTCFPKTRSAYSNKDIARINFAKCEVLTIGKDSKLPDTPKGFFACFHIARSPIESYLNDNFAPLVSGIPSFSLFDHKYRFAGQDQLAFLVFSEEDAINAINHPDLGKAIRLMNLRLMQKRANMYSRYHCMPLADKIFASHGQGRRQ